MRTFSFVAPILIGISSRVKSLSEIQEIVLNALNRCDDYCIVGAHAVNAYAIGHERGTVDVDVVVLRMDHVLPKITEAFQKARIPFEVIGKRRKRIMIQHRGKKVSVLDMTQADILPEIRTIEGLRIVALEPLKAMKALAADHRKGTPKGLQDLADLKRLEVIRKDPFENRQGKRKIE